MQISSTITILSIAVASNLDNGGVGITYGIRNITVSWLPNFVIAIISFIATFLAGLFGAVISVWIPPFVSKLLGGAVIILIGVGVFAQPLLKEKAAKSTNRVLQIIRDPEKADFNGNRRIGVGESLVLGIALSMNALAGGFDAGIIHVSVIGISTLVGIFSFALLGMGAYLGQRYLAKRLGYGATVLAGILLIFIGMHQLV